MTKSEVQKRIKAYFDSRYTPMKDRNNVPITDEDGKPVYEMSRPPTLSGLAAALGLDERDKLMTFTKNKAILGEVRRAVLRIEEYAEERLFSKNASTSGIKLYLSTNFQRWSERETEKFVLPDELAKWAE